MKRNRIITLLGLTFASSISLALSCGDDDAINPVSTFDAGTVQRDTAPPDDGGIHRDAQIMHRCRASQR
jgi:hypothetical protein